MFTRGQCVLSWECAWVDWRVKWKCLGIKQESNDLKVFATDCVSWICESVYLNITQEKK